MQIIITVENEQKIYEVDEACLQKIFLEGPPQKGDLKGKSNNDLCFEIKSGESSPWAGTYVFSDLAQKNALLELINQDDDKKNYASIKITPEQVKAVAEEFQPHPIALWIEKIVNDLQMHQEGKSQFETVTLSDAYKDITIFIRFLNFIDPIKFTENAPSLENKPSYQNLFPIFGNADSSIEDLKQELEKLKNQYKIISKFQKKILQFRTFYFTVNGIDSFNKNSFDNPNDRFIQKCKQLLTQLQPSKDILQDIIGLLELKINEKIKQQNFTEKYGEKVIVLRTFLPRENDEELRKTFGITSAGHSTVELIRNEKERKYIGIYLLPKEAREAIGDQLTMKAKFLQAMGLSSSDDATAFFVDLKYDLNLVGPREQKKRFQRCQEVVLHCNLEGATLDFEAAWKSATNLLQESKPITYDNKKYQTTQYNFYEQNCATISVAPIKAAKAEEHLAYTGASLGVDNPTLVRDYVKKLEEELQLKAKRFAKIKELQNKISKDSQLNFESVLQLTILQLRNIPLSNQPENKQLISDLILQLENAKEELKLLNEKAAFNYYLKNLGSAVYHGVNQILQGNFEFKYDIAKILNDLLLHLPRTNEETIVSQNVVTKYQIERALLLMLPTRHLRESITPNNDISLTIKNDLKANDANILLNYHQWLSTYAGEQFQNIEPKVKEIYKDIVEKYVIDCDRKDLNTLKPSEFICYRANNILELSHIALKDAPIVPQYSTGQLFDKHLRINHAIAQIKIYREDDRRQDRLTKELDEFYSKTLAAFTKFQAILNQKLYFEPGMTDESRNTLTNSIQRILLKDNSIDLQPEILEHNSKSWNMRLVKDDRLKHNETDQKTIVAHYACYNESGSQQDVPKKPPLWKFWQYNRRQEYFELAIKGKIFAIEDNEKLSSLAKAKYIDHIVDIYRPNALQFWRRDERQRYDEMAAYAKLRCYYSAFIRGEINESQFYVRLEKLIPMFHKKSDELKTFLTLFKKRYEENINEAENFQQFQLGKHAPQQENSAHKVEASSSLVESAKTQDKYKTVNYTEAVSDQFQLILAHYRSDLIDVVDDPNVFVLCIAAEKYRGYAKKFNEGPKEPDEQKQSPVDYKQNRFTMFGKMVDEKTSIQDKIEIEIHGERLFQDTFTKLGNP